MFNRHVFLRNSFTVQVRGVNVVKAAKVSVNHELEQQVTCLFMIELGCVNVLGDAEGLKIAKISNSMLSEMSELQS